MKMALTFGQPGWQELLLLVLVLILLFGAKKLPELARSLGRSINEFKKGKDEAAREISEPDKADTAKDKEA